MRKSRNSSKNSRNPTTSRTSTITPIFPRTSTYKALSVSGEKLRTSKAGSRSGPAFRILGIDPGLAAIGWGLLEARGGRLSHLGHGCLKTTAEEPIDRRLLAIHEGISRLIEEWEPDLCGMESLFFFRNVTSAFPVAEARGVIRLAVIQAGISLEDYTPTAIKQAVTGTARADKAQVQEMVRLLLGLSEIPEPDHAADALAAAICRWHHVGPLSAREEVPALQGPSRSRSRKG